MLREQIKRGTSTKIDGSVLELYCETYSRWRSCKEEINGKFFIDIPVTDSNGAINWKRGPNPALASLEKCEGLMRQLLAQLGATPGSRAVKAAILTGVSHLPMQLFLLHAIPSTFSPRVTSIPQ